jgi:hypothetical protein
VLTRLVIRAVVLTALAAAGVCLGYRATIGSYRSDQFCGARTIALRARGWSQFRKWSWNWQPGYVTTCVYRLRNGNVVAMTPPQ